MHFTLSALESPWEGHPHYMVLDFDNSIYGLRALKNRSQLFFFPHFANMPSLLGE